MGCSAWVVRGSPWVCGGGCSAAGLNWKTALTRAARELVPEISLDIQLASMGPKAVWREVG